ncbi:MAG: heparinase II/III family protein [Armatimonadota bacterium]|nr:heparinase II/III family protein [Armatimonadota bacterium]
MRAMLLVAVVLLVSSTIQAVAQRPFLSYECDPEATRERLEDRFPQSDDELLASVKPRQPLAEENAPPRAAADLLFRLHQTTGEADPGERAARILAALTAPWLEVSEDELRAQITERGALDDSNIAMRLVAWDLARLWRLTGDANAARRCALILQRYAQVMPQWPLVTREGQLRDQDDEAYRRAWDANGLWGVWFVSDIEFGLPVVRAFDMIHASGAMQQLGAVEQIERDLIRHIPEHYLERPLGLGNLTHYMLRSLPLYGMAIPEPHYVHIAVQRYRYIINAMYYADGFWHEGSPSYHKDITVGLTRRAPAAVEGYSDPPGYTCEIDLPRYDHLDLAAEYARQHQRMWDALKKLTFPNKDYAKLHDASFPHGAWWDSKPQRSYPRILGCMGHAILGTGEGDDQAQLHLHYSGTHGHEHYDALSIILFAGGREHLSETKYRAPDDWPSTREWQTMTAGHNTVVIDEQNQQGRFPHESHRRPITEADAMEGISQHAGMTIDIPNWRYRDGGHGNALNDPKLRCFCPDWDTVQVAEAEGERAWYPEPEIYRRTVALVRIDGSQVYAVDIFRVRGGETHDWMLHGCLQDPYTLTTSLDLTPMEGVLHQYLDMLRAADTGEGWTAQFDYQAGSSLRTHVLGAPGTRVIVARGPAMRHEGYADFIDVRRTSGESVFVAVHDAFQGRPNVQSIEPVQWGGPMDVGLRVTLADGRTDLILSSADDGPFAEHATAGGVTFAGRFAHLRFDGDRPVHAYGVDATRLAAGDIDLSGPGWHQGEVIATHRVEAGDEFDAFETDAELPEGLEGRCLVVDLGGTLTQAFIIDRVEARETGSMIYSRDEPGMEIRGELIKMMYYPGWGIPRPCRFHIADTLLRTAEG